MAYGEDSGTQAADDENDDVGLDQTPSYSDGAAGGNDPNGGAPDPDDDDDDGFSADLDDPDVDGAGGDDVGLDQTPSYAGGPAGGNDPNGGAPDPDDSGESTGSGSSDDGSDDDRVPNYDGRKTRLTGERFTPADDSDRRQVLDKAGDDGQRVTPEDDDPLRPDADSQGLEERTNLGLFSAGGTAEGSREDEAVERLQGEVDREIPGVLAVETDEYNVRRDGEGGYEVVLTDRGARDVQATIRNGADPRSNGVRGNDAPPSDDADPFEPVGSDDGEGVPRVDGRKTAILGPDAAGNPTNEPIAIVLDRAGDEGERVFPRDDDPLAPDTRDAARAIGEDPATSDEAINERGEQDRVGALRTVVAPGAVANETRGSTDSDTVDVFEGRSTSSTSSNQSAERGERVAAVTRFSQQQLNARREVEREILERAGLEDVDDAGRFVQVERSGDQIAATLTERGERESARRQFAQAQGVAPENVDVERTESGEFRVEVQSAAAQRAEERGPLEGLEEGRGALPSTGEGRVTAPTRETLNPEVAAVSENQDPIDTLRELFGPDRAPDNSDSAIEEAARRLGVEDSVPDLPSEEEIVADVRAQSVFEQGDLEARLSDAANEEVDDQTGVNPRETRATAERETRDAVRSIVRDAQENPARAAAAGAPVAASEPTPAGEAALVVGIAAGVAGVDVASRIDDSSEIETPTDPAPASAEIEVPGEVVRDRPEIDTPADPSEETGELEEPADPTPVESEVDVPTGDEQPAVDVIRAGEAGIRDGTNVGPGPQTPAEPTIDEPTEPTVDETGEESGREVAGERPEQGVRVPGEESTEPELPVEQRPEEFTRELREGLLEELGGPETRYDPAAGVAARSEVRDEPINDAVVEDPAASRGRTGEEVESRPDDVAEPEAFGTPFAFPALEAGLRVGADVGTGTGTTTSTTSTTSTTETTTNITDFGTPTVPRGNPRVPDPPTNRIPFDDGGSGGSNSDPLEELFDATPFDTGVAQTLEELERRL